MGHLAKPGLALTGVVNHEEQYSIWPVDRENPLGWRDSDPSVHKAECLAYINEVWTDMWLLSLRKYMEEMARQQAENPPPPPPLPSTELLKPDELVTGLAMGDHPVEVGLLPEKKPRKHSKPPLIGDMCI